MGGDRVTPLPVSLTTEQESSADQDLSQVSTSVKPFYHLSQKIEDGSVNEENWLEFEGFGEVGRRMSSTSLEFQWSHSKRDRAYREVLQSYHQSRVRIKNLKEAKSKILSYTPGKWIKEVGGITLTDNGLPKTATLLLVGPKGSGKSSLVNRISNVFEDDMFASERAQVSYNSSVGGGTYFLQEYMIPRGSTSFCLYDTRGLSDDASDNIKMLKQWINKGVRHGKLIIRPLDSTSLRATMKCKARESGCQFKSRMVNSVIFVVNGHEVLKSMDSDVDEGKKYMQMIATTFNCPYLSFKDDKPPVVVTHGDLLTLADRARVCVHLGEQLGLPPTKQIFDIPESCDPVTELTIVDMLRYSLEHADKNLHRKDSKMVRRLSCLFLFIAVVNVILSIWLQLLHIYRAPEPRKQHVQVHHAPEPEVYIDWHKIRHLWL